MLITESLVNDYANAFILRHSIITASHVAQGVKRVLVPESNEWGTFHFWHSPQQDLAFSTENIPTVGIERVRRPQVGELVIVRGHHGPHLQFYEIPARVLAIRPDRKIVIERTSGMLFQPGMSGSPAFTENGEVVGVLFRGVDGTHGEQVILEALTSTR